MTKIKYNSWYTASVEEILNDLRAAGFSRPGQILALDHLLQERNMTYEDLQWCKNLDSDGDTWI